MTKTDWMEQEPETVLREYRKRPTRRRGWNTITPHRTNKRGRGIVGRLMRKRR